MGSSHSILVPLSSNPASIEAVSVAALLAKARKSRLQVVHIIEVLRSLPLTAELEPEARRGEQLLRRAEEVAAALGVRVEGALVQARTAGQAIVEEAAERQVDTIVLGVSSHQLITGTASLGPTADVVLRNAPCQVIVVRQPLPRPVSQHAAREVSQR